MLSLKLFKKTHFRNALKQFGRTHFLNFMAHLFTGRFDRGTTNKLWSNVFKKDHLLRRITGYLLYFIKSFTLPKLFGILMLHALSLRN